MNLASVVCFIDMGISLSDMLFIFSFVYLTTVVVSVGLSQFNVHTGEQTQVLLTCCCLSSVDSECLA
jgi:hypothetical protein